MRKVMILNGPMKNFLFKNNSTIPNSYKIKSLEKKNGRYEYIKGNFYEQELQKTKMA